MHNLSAARAVLPPPETAADPCIDDTVTIAAEPGESVDSVVGRLAAAVNVREEAILAMFVFGDTSVREQATHAFRSRLGPIDWPILWVEGRSCHEASLAGIQVFTFGSPDVERVLVGGHIVGTVFEDSGARHCILAGVGPQRVVASRTDQTFETLENVRLALESAGFGFGDIARTWFYNDKLLHWYGAFNRVRTSYYGPQPFRTGVLPASTGVDGSNPYGAALAMCAWAVRPHGDSLVREAASPLQCPAPGYGSSFSRGIEIVSGGRRRLLVSGTASIGLNGETQWKDDTPKQVGRTMEVVDAILSNRNMGFADVHRAIAYFKRAADFEVFERWQRTSGISIPVLYVNCNICRQDLLFEIELDAARPLDACEECA